MVTDTDSQSMVRREPALARALTRVHLPAFIGPLAMALGFLVVVAIAASNLWLINRGADTRAWIDHTHAVQGAIEDVRANLHASESARRGFLLDPDPVLDEAYRQSSARMDPALERLRALVADSPEQSAHLSSIAGLIEAHDRAQTASVLGVRIGAGRTAAQSFASDGSSARITALEALLTQMSERESALLAQRTARESETMRLLNATTIAGVVLIAVLGVLSIIAYARDAAAVEKSRDQLRRFNEELETQVAHRTADLQQANAEIQRFAHLISHDLRAPLVNIVGFVNELRHVREGYAKPPGQRPAALDDDFDEAIRFIQASAEKMDRLVNSILRMAREGRRTLTPQDLDMTPLVRAIADAVRHQAVERDITIDIQENLPAIVSDRLAIEQVFSNLIDNAVKYAKKDAPGAVRIRGRAIADWVEYEIVDNGIGIAPKDQVRIFDMFRRAANSDEPGEGVGLAYTRQIVRRLGGSIQLHSRLGEGAIFRVSLPRRLVPADNGDV